MEAWRGENGAWLGQRRQLYLKVTQRDLLHWFHIEEAEGLVAPWSMRLQASVAPEGLVGA